MSNFVVSARKYRPIRFEDVVGQEHVTQTLKNALRNDQLAHAFLFCGPRGVGKTTCARILAKVLNCQNVTAEFEPCGACNSCKTFEENASFNITELDAASNNSVEHIRALIEQVRFQPQQGKYKIFIIDEVHMLSSQAFNAFLKTLEEPPPYAIFILATTEKHKILPTILSRCQIFDFRRIQVPRMVEHLQEICTDKGIKAELDALHIVAQKADGALRDALSIFDRIVSFSGDKVTYEDVISNLNVLDYDYYFQIVDAFLTEDRSRILNLFDKIINNGFEPDIFLIGLAEHLRNLLVCKDAATLQLLEVSNSLKERYHQQARITPASFILTALNLANDCDVNYKMARNKRLQVEIALLKMTYINRAISLPQQTLNTSIAEKKKSVEKPLTSKTAELEENVSPQKEEQASQKKSQASTQKVEEPVVKMQKPSTLNKVSSKPTLRRSSKHSMVNIKNLNAITQEVVEIKESKEDERQSLDIELVQKSWDQYMEQVSSGSAQSVMRNTELSIEGEKIIATVASKFAENMLRQERGVLDSLRLIFKQPNLAINIRIDDSKIADRELPKRKKILTPREKYIQMVETNPLVKDLVKKFGLVPDEN